MKYANGINAREPSSFLSASDGTLHDHLVVLVDRGRLLQPIVLLPLPLLRQVRLEVRVRQAYVGSNSII